MNGPFRRGENEIDKREFFERELSELRRQNQEALENERENFRNLYRQIPEMVCILSGPDHVFEFVNEAHVRALGFDATGQSVRQAQPESVEVHGILDSVYSTGVTAELHEIPVTLTGQLRRFNLTYSARRDVDGNINGIMILGAEVTEQVLTREILKIQTQAFELTLSGAPLEQVLGVLCKAVEMQIGRGSIAVVHLVGDVGPQSSKEPSLPKVWSTPILSSQEKWIATFTLYSAGTLRLGPHEQQVLKLVNRTAALVIERDLEAKVKLKTQQDLDRTEQRFRASEEQLGLAVEVARVGFYDWDILEDQIVFSHEMCQAWGVKPGSFRTLLDAAQFIHVDDRERVLYAVQESVANKTPFHTQYRVVRPDASVAWMEVRGRIHFDNDGNPIRFFGTSVDISEQKIHELKLQQAQSAAENANAAKGIFLANMSHEIRTPLGAVMGFLELLKNPNVSRNELQAHIGVIDRNSRQLLRIVDDILDLSKIEAGKFTIESIQFSLPELLVDFKSLMSLKANEKGLTFELKLETKIPRMVTGDPTRLRQILSNVVGNAIKFTEKGHVRLLIGFENNVLKMAVEDTGPGLTAASVEKLFKPFSQADNSTTRIYGGTGLGLNLTRRLCEALNGSFGLERSEVGQGSTFVATVVLEVDRDCVMVGPLLASPTKVPAAKTSADDDSLKGARILVVEDSIDNQALIRFFLKRWGSQIDFASNGEEGVRKAIRSSYDIILMDVQMPIMDGHEATQRMRAAGLTVPIVALTAHAMKEERQRCLDSGFSYFLTKPIDKESLYKILLELYETTKTQTEAEAPI